MGPAERPYLKGRHDDRRREGPLMRERYVLELVWGTIFFFSVIAGGMHGVYLAHALLSRQPWHFAAFHLGVILLMAGLGLLAYPRWKKLREE